MFADDYRRPVDAHIRNWSPSVPERPAGRRRSVARGKEADSEERPCLSKTEGIRGRTGKRRDRASQPAPFLSSQPSHQSRQKSRRPGSGGGRRVEIGIYVTLAGHGIDRPCHLFVADLPRVVGRADEQAKIAEGYDGAGKAFGKPMDYVKGLAIEDLRLLAETRNVQSVLYEIPRFFQAERGKIILHGQPLPEFRYRLHGAPQRFLTGEDKGKEILLFVGEVEEHPQVLKDLGSATEGMSLVDHHYGFPPLRFHPGELFLHVCKVEKLVGMRLCKEKTAADL